MCILVYFGLQLRGNFCVSHQSNPVFMTFNWFFQADNPLVLPQCHEWYLNFDGVAYSFASRGQYH